MSFVLQTTDLLAAYVILESWPARSPTLAPSCGHWTRCKDCRMFLIKLWNGNYLIMLRNLINILLAEVVVASDPGSSVTLVKVMIPSRNLSPQFLFTRSQDWDKTRHRRPAFLFLFPINVTRSRYCRYVVRVLCGWWWQYWSQLRHQKENNLTI